VQKLFFIFPSFSVLHDRFSCTTCYILLDLLYTGFLFLYTSSHNFVVVSSFFISSCICFWLEH